MAGQLKENLEKIQVVVERERNCNLVPSSPTILAVSKKQSAEKVESLFDLGIKDFGENYIQEALAKKQALKQLPIRWHFIGQLQRKKIKDIVGEFYLIQTVSRVVELQKISEVASDKGCVQKVLIQVNVANEDSKQGVSLADLEKLVELAIQASNIELLGFMFFPPLSESEPETLEWFEKCSTLFRNWQSKYPDSFVTLSMGTSHDYPLALRKGATMVRLGECLMGPRS